MSFVPVSVTAWLQKGDLAELFVSVTAWLQKGDLDGLCPNFCNYNWLQKGDLAELSQFQYCVAQKEGGPYCVVPVSGTRGYRRREDLAELSHTRARACTHTHTHTPFNIHLDITITVDWA